MGELHADKGGIARRVHVVSPNNKAQPTRQHDGVIGLTRFHPLSTATLDLGPARPS